MLAYTMTVDGKETARHIRVGCPYAYREKGENIDRVTGKERTLTIHCADGRSAAVKIRPQPIMFVSPCNKLALPDGQKSLVSKALMADANTWETVLKVNGTALIQLLGEEHQHGGLLGKLQELSAMLGIDLFTGCKSNKDRTGISEAYQQSMLTSGTPGLTEQFMVYGGHIMIQMRNTGLPGYRLDGTQAKQLDNAVFSRLTRR